MKMQEIKDKKSIEDLKAEKSQNKLNLKLTDSSVYNMEIKAHDLQTSEQIQSFIDEISE